MAWPVGYQFISQSATTKYENGFFRLLLHTIQMLGFAKFCFLFSLVCGLCHWPKCELITQLISPSK